MPKDDFDTAPMVLLVYTQEFGEINYTLPIQGPYDVTTPLTAIQLEAQSKGCAVMIQIALIPLEQFWGEQEDESEGETEDE